MRLVTPGTSVRVSVRVSVLVSIRVSIKVKEYKDVVCSGRCSM